VVVAFTVTVRRVAEVDAETTPSTFSTVGWTRRARSPGRIQAPGVPDREISVRLRGLRAASNHHKPSTASPMPAGIIHVCAVRPSMALAVFLVQEEPPNAPAAMRASRIPTTPRASTTNASSTAQGAAAGVAVGVRPAVGSTGAASGSGPTSSPAVVSVGSAVLGSMVLGSVVLGSVVLVCVEWRGPVGVLIARSWSSRRRWCRARRR